MKDFRRIGMLQMINIFSGSSPYTKRKLNCFVPDITQFKSLSADIEIIIAAKSFPSGNR
jgi:hypothetical protein